MKLNRKALFIPQWNLSKGVTAFRAPSAYRGIKAVWNP